MRPTGSPGQRTGPPAGTYKSRTENRNADDLFSVKRPDPRPQLSRAERKRERARKRGSKRERLRGFRSNSAQEDAHWLTQVNRARPDAAFLGESRVAA